MITKADSGWNWTVWQRSEPERPEVGPSSRAVHQVASATLPLSGEEIGLDRGSLITSAAEGLRPLQAAQE